MPLLEFTPLEFETDHKNDDEYVSFWIRIYSVGVWNNLDLDESDITSSH